jgi:heterodisulfide reductase subunit C
VDAQKFHCKFVRLMEELTTEAQSPQRWHRELINALCALCGLCASVVNLRN